MLKCALFLTFIFQFIHVNAQLDFYYLNEWHYKGNPKNVTISTYTVETDSVSLEESVVQSKVMQVDKYNENRKCTSHQWLNIDKEITREFQFIYDSLGNQIEFREIDAGAKLTGRYVAVFDSNNNEIGHDHYDSENNLKSRSVTIEKIEGLKQTTQVINLLGEVQNEYESTLDTLGREIRRLFYTEDSLISHEQRYKYDVNDKLVEQLVIKPYRDTTKTTYTCDEFGRNTEIKSNGPNSFAFITVYIDSLNQRENYEYNNERLTCVTYSNLDSNDCITKQIEQSTHYPPRMSRSDNILHYETETRYLYDDHFNWIEKIEISNSGLKTIQKRVFEYYL